MGRAESLLKRRRYKIRGLSANGFEGERYRLSRLSYAVIHLSLLALVVAVVFAGLTGFSEPFVSVIEGQEREIGHGTGLSIALDSFLVDYWPDGTPKTYASEITVREAGGTETRGTILVNHPLNVDGVRAFQAGFGRAPEFSIGTNGDPPVPVVIALEGVYQDGALRRPAGMVRVPELGVEAWAIGAAEGAADPVLEPEQVLVELTQDDGATSLGQLVVSPGTTGSIDDFTVDFLDERWFSGFSISEEPARPALWITAALFIIGLMGALWFPYSALSVRAGGQGEGDRHLVLAVRGSARQGSRSNCPAGAGTRGSTSTAGSAR